MANMKGMGAPLKAVEDLLKETADAGDFEKKIRSLVPKFKSIDDPYSMRLLDVFARKHLQCSAKDLVWNRYYLDAEAELDCAVAEIDADRKARVEAWLAEKDLAEKDGDGRNCLDDPGRELVNRVVKEVGLDSFLTEHRGKFSRTTLIDYKVGKRNLSISAEMVNTIIAAARETEAKLNK